MRYFVAVLIVTILTLVAVSQRVSAAEHKGKAITDPKEAGVDFRLQGEYAGEFESDGEQRELGIQVIALGGDKFRAVAYVGGLPGDGWKKGGEWYSADGELKDEKVTFRSEGDNGPHDATAILEEGKITVKHGDQTIAVLKKVERKSPTLGAKPPKSAIVLFDGSGVDEWEHGKLVDEKYLGATGAVSKRKFGDHTLHIEFRTPFMPEARGQGRGNSGVYIQGRYECQVLDSFGLEGEDNECGGIYSIAKPVVNMCYPPLAWQTYDIDFTAARYDDSGQKAKNARVTIKHNGVVIHNDLELPHGTPGFRAEGSEPDAIFLQDHGNPVVFRNIWVVEK